MTDLGTFLESRGLEQYLDAFLGEGFDSLDTLVDIQESDFDALNVKLGHRRKLQRAIAEYRGIPFERLVAISSYEGSPDGIRGGDGPSVSSAGSVSGASGGTETKRKYRRHPKPDENAPERPPSAYVIFSNKVREEVKDRNLTFTQIAKLVGERWQKLDPEGKEPYEANANAAKERYNIQLSAYKKTDAYKEYMQYLADFKAKHGTGTSETKRPKLDQESSGSIISSKSLELQSELLIPGQGGHLRVDSTGSMASSANATVIPSPVYGVGTTLPAQILPQGSVYSQKSLRASTRGASPTGTHPGREPQRRGQLSNQSSISDDSLASRSNSETLQQAASLSLNTPPSATPPLSSLSSSGLQDHGVTQDSFRRFQNAALQTTMPGYGTQTTVVGSFGNPFGQTLPSPTGSENVWRTRSLDLRGYAEPARAMQPPLLGTSGGPGNPGTLPPLIGSDRFSDPQRTLPPPRSSPVTTQQPNLPQGTRLLSEPPRPYHFGSTPSRQQPQNEIHLDRSESDAADALAGLAAGGPRSETARPPDPKWHNR